MPDEKFIEDDPGFFMHVDGPDDEGPEDIVEVREPRCSERECKHFLGVFQKDGQYVPYCSAFPDGIPDEIAYGDNLHTKHFPGDHGILYTRE